MWTQFFTHVIELVTQIRSHGETLEERSIVEKFLRSFPARIDVIVVTIEETKDLSQFSADELNASLQQASHWSMLSRHKFPLVKVEAEHKWKWQ